MGSVAGHAASLLREAKIPSIFELGGAFEHIKDGDPISLDAVQPRIYSGMLWSPRIIESQIRERYQESSVKADPINRRLLVLHLLRYLRLPTFARQAASQRTTCCGTATRRRWKRCSPSTTTPWKAI